MAKLACHRICTIRLRASGMADCATQHVMTALPSSEDVLDYWFGALDASGCADAEHAKRWWSKAPQLDDEIRARFGLLHAAALSGKLASWPDTPRGALAYVVVLDQFSRNMYRDTAAMFAGDALALAAALSCIDRGLHRALRLDERSTIYMPLMHSEHLSLQERCVQLYREFADEVSNGARASLLSRVGYAERHRDIVRKFGRFPHRNPLLGRTSTPAEIEFLKGPGSSF
jgi:uncharacterized protein (DUF924 family)